MPLTFITINGLQFIVQSYCKDDFVHLASTSGIASIRIDWINSKRSGHISTSGKEDTKWKEFVAKIDIMEIKERVDIMFNTKPK